MRRLRSLFKSESAPGASQDRGGRTSPPASRPGDAWGAAPQPSAGAATSPAPAEDGVDLVRRRDELRTRFAELQCDLGGLVYEMAIRDHVRVDVIVQRAALLQDVDAELGEVERILRLEESGTAGACARCGAPHSTGAVYCWQCGQPLLEHVASSAIGT
jgi:hypothetical protein